MSDINWSEYSYQEMATIFQTIPILTSEWSKVEQWQNDAFNEDVFLTRYDIIRRNRIAEIWHTPDRFIWEVQVFRGEDAFARGGEAGTIEEAKIQADLLLKSLNVIFPDYEGKI